MGEVSLYCLHDDTAEASSQHLRVLVLVFECVGVLLCHCVIVLACWCVGVLLCYCVIV